MIKSMTGFGKSEAILESKKITIEVKSLNSKQADLNMRVPSIYREKELILRKRITQSLLRGKIDCSVYVENTGDTNNYQINTGLIKDYYNQLKTLDFVEQGQTDYMSVLMRMPDVMKNERPTLEEEEWVRLSDAVNDALERINTFRQQEGESLAKELSKRVDNIDKLLKDLEQYEDERIQKVRDRISGNIQDVIDKSNVDENRLEQEIIFYIEKFDVTEEKVRLKTHCEYFISTLNGDAGQGRKLGFIAQEMGREINTLGSKANHSDIQKIVVNMKDELEKIKEQVLNVL